MKRRVPAIRPTRRRSIASIPAPAARPPPRANFYNPYAAKNKPPKRRSGTRRRISKDAFVEPDDNVIDVLSSSPARDSGEEDDDSGRDSDDDAEDNDSGVFTENDDEYVAGIPEPPPLQRRRSLRTAVAQDPDSRHEEEDVVRRAMYETARKQVEELQAKLERAEKQRDKAQALAMKANATVVEKLSDEDADVGPREFPSFPLGVDRPNGDSPGGVDHSVASQAPGEAPLPPPRAGAGAAAAADKNVMKMEDIAGKFIRDVADVGAGVVSAEEVNQLASQGYPAESIAKVVKEINTMVRSSLLALVRSFFDAIPGVSESARERAVILAAHKLQIPVHPIDGPLFPLLVGEPGSGKSYIMAIFTRVVDAMFGELATFMRLTVGLLEAKYSGVAEKDAAAVFLFAKTAKKTTTVGRVLDILGGIVEGLIPPHVAVARDVPLVIDTPITIVLNDEVETLMPARSNDSAKSSVCSECAQHIGAKLARPGHRVVVFFGATNNPADITASMRSRATEIPILRPSTPAARKAAIASGMRVACPGWKAFPSPIVESLAMQLFADGDRRVIARLGKAVLDASARTDDAAAARVPLSGKEALGSVFAGIASVWSSGGATAAALSVGVDKAWDAAALPPMLDATELSRRAIAAIPEATYVMLIKAQIQLAQSSSRFAAHAGSRLWGATVPEVVPCEDDGE